MKHPEIMSSLTSEWVLSKHAVNFNGKMKLACKQERALPVLGVVLPGYGLCPEPENKVTG